MKTKRSAWPCACALAVSALLLSAACGDGGPSLKDTSYWQAKFAKGDPDAIKNLAAEGAAALPTLEALLEDPRELVVQNAAMAMGEMGDVAAPAVPELLDAIARFPGNPFLAQTLEELKGAAVPAMIEVLKGNDPAMKKQMATILVGVGEAGEIAIPALIAVIEGDDPDPVRLEAIGAVGALSVKALNGDALAALKVLRDQGGELAIYAGRVIQRIEHALDQAAKLEAEKAAGN